MKKIFKTLMIMLLSVVVVTGCKKDKKIEKFMLERHEGMVSYIDITQEELEAKILKKDDFILYVYGAMCGHCAAFSPYMKSFIETTESVIYRIEGSLITDFSLVPGLKHTPSLAFYNSGEMIKLTSPSKNRKDDPFKSVENLTKYIQKYAYIPDIKEISKNQLDELIAEDASFVLYIASSSCGDCAHFKENVLTPYLKENEVSTDFYFLDVDKFLSRSIDGEPTEEWINFKNQYGLSESGNPEYGYGSGYVPTIQKYTNGVITNAFVYLNDISFENGSLIVTEGYYGNESGKVGTTYEDYYSYQDDLMPFYKNKFIEFMEK